MKRYILTTTTYHTEEELDFYGVALVEQDGNSYELIRAFNDLTQDKTAIENLIDDCNELGLEEIHFKDVVEDLMSFK